MSYLHIYYDNERFERIIKIAENYPDLSCFVYVERGLYSGLSIKKETPGIEKGDELMILSPYLSVFEPIFQYEKQYKNFNELNNIDDLDDILSLRMGY